MITKTTGMVTITLVLFTLPDKSHTYYFLDISFGQSRTDTEYDDALIVKLFVFMFVNSYAALYFIAFVKVSTAGAAPTEKIGCVLFFVAIKHLFSSFAPLIFADV